MMKKVNALVVGIVFLLLPAAALQVHEFVPVQKLRSDDLEQVDPHLD